MTTRLRSRVSAVEEKVACSGPNNAIRLYFVEGYPTDGAEDLLRALTDINLHIHPHDGYRCTGTCCEP